MLALVLALSLSAPQSCESACSSEANKCFGTCGGAQKCSNRCDGRQNDCLAGCAAKSKQARADKKAKKPETPCGFTKDEGPKPCTEDEKKMMKDALASKQAKALCKDKEGNVVPCEGDEARAKAEFEKVKPKCQFADGVPGECPK